MRERAERKTKVCMAKKGERRDGENQRRVRVYIQPDNPEQPNLNDKGWVGLVFWVGLGCFF